MYITKNMTSEQIAKKFGCHPTTILDKIHKFKIPIVGKKYSKNPNSRGACNSKLIKARDNFICQKCGEVNCLEVHHILPLVYGGSNDPTNLITLCKNCHKKAPDKPDNFFEWLSIPLSPTYNLIYKTMIGHQGYIMMEVLDSMGIEFKFEESCLICKADISHFDKPKKFIELLDSKKAVDNVFEKIINVCNQNKNKCKSYELWKKKIRK